MWKYNVRTGFPGGSAVKSPPAMQGTRVWSLGWEDSLEEETATHSIFLSGEVDGQRGLVGYSPWGCRESDTTEQQQQERVNTRAWKKAGWYEVRNCFCIFLCISQFSIWLRVTSEIREKKVPSNHKTKYHKVTESLTSLVKHRWDLLEPFWGQGLGWLLMSSRTPGREGERRAGLTQRLPHSLPPPDSPALPALSTDFTALINAPKNGACSLFKAN